MISMEGLAIAFFSLLLFLILTLFGEAQAAVYPKRNTSHSDQSGDLPEETAGEYFPLILLTGVTAAVAVWIFPMAVMGKSWQKISVILCGAAAAIVIVAVKKGIAD